MHNGGIPGFNKMKRQLLSLLGDEAYEAIEGTTDSEVGDDNTSLCSISYRSTAGGHHSVVVFDLQPELCPFFL